MKPDFLDELSVEDVVLPPPDVELKLNDEDVRYIFSCVINTPQMDLLSSITMGIKFVGLGSLDYRISNEVINEKIGKDNYVIIEFGKDFFEADPSPYMVRNLCFYLCNIVGSTSCTLSLKNTKNEIETIDFSIRELCRDTIKTSSEILVLNENKCFVKEADYSLIEDGLNDALRISEVHERLTKFLGARLDHSNRLVNCSTISLEKDFLNIKSIIRHKNLLLINKDSDVAIEEDAIEYLYGILEKGKDKIHNEKFPTPSLYPTFHGLFFPELIIHIPIILKKRTPSYEELWGNNIDIRYIPSGRVLGYYSREDTICKGPHIVLSPEEIAISAHRDGIPYKTLFAKVLIHEIAHAVMDNYETDGRLIVKESENWPRKLEAIAMEESLANMITIKWFEENAPEDLEDVKLFINNQNCIYQFGLWQDNIDAHWEKWSKLAKEDTEPLKEWFNKCFSSGNIKIPMEDYTKEMYDDVFI